MPERRPLIRRDDGNLGELPVGDVVPGIDTRLAVPVPRVNEWFNQPIGATAASQSIPNGDMRLGNFYLPGGTYDAVAFLLWNAGSAGALIKAVAYLDGGGAPVGLVMDTATVDAATSGTKQVTGLSIVIPAGGRMLWVGTVTQGAPSTLPQVACVPAGTSLPYVSATVSGTPLGYSLTSAFLATGVTGSAPGTPTVTRVEQAAARLAFRRSA